MIFGAFGALFTINARI